VKILIACEYSGRVRDSFIAKGHSATSCDFIPSDSSKGDHYQGDVNNILYYDWDMIIAFPPCTDLARSGARWFKEKQADGRQQASIDFFMKFSSLDCEKVCIENPVGIMSTAWRKPDQIIHPWMFGDRASKQTCLWLKGLPKLEPTNIVDKGARHITKSGKSIPEWYNIPPSPDRAKIRSLTFQGIADAMAEQWG